ncbi:MAG TPA: response regulator [Thermoanaerobaculia bacterium]|nr:response regulator [Thermoanaerobaculia bacterium]
MASRPLGAVLVDDEELARSLVRQLLAAHPDIRILAECANGFEAVKAVAEMKPDLLFLDVQMPLLDGLEVLELIERDATGRPAVIFVTAYDQYALKAFEENAVDYLLKPFDRSRFDTALARARARLAAGIAPAADLPVPRGAPLSRVVVKDGVTVTVLPVATIDYVKAEDDYVLLRSAGRNHLKKQTLASLEEALPKERFVRVHRSYLLNLDRLARVEPSATGAPTAVLTDGARLPVSRAGAQRLNELLGR